MSFKDFVRFAPLSLALTLGTVTAAIAAPSYQKIVGDWQSNFGPVHIVLVKAEKPKGSATFSGQWLEPPGNKKGKIESAHYNSKTGQMEIAYEETWSKNHGKAKLSLDKSGKEFSGDFKSDDGNTGTWTWTRK